MRKKKIVRRPFHLDECYSFGNINPIWKKVHYKEKVLVYV